MSYQIYYDRAYVRVDDKYIPIINSGSNNCFEHSYSGRMIPEKNWNVLHWKREKQFLFTETEIREIANDYDRYNQECGLMFKTRNRCFASGEFERWVINGMKSAHTVEEYVSYGNGFYVLNYSPGKTADWTRHPFQTTEELLHILESLKTSDLVDIKFENNRSVSRPIASRAPKTVLRACDLSEYYVLKGNRADQTIYFAGLSRRGGFHYVLYCPCNAIRVFQSEKDALQYLKKYNDRLPSQYNFVPECVKSAS